MGTIRHHAIIVTGWDKEPAEKARSIAASIFPAVSELLPSERNGDWSFFIPPDGSKEGWDVSDEGDIRRDKFVEWLRGQTGCSWVEVCYHDDYGPPKIVRSNESEREDD